MDAVAVSFGHIERYNPNRKRNETNETLLARARRCAPPRARWAGTCQVGILVGHTTRS